MSTALSVTPTLSLGRAMKWMFASPKWMANLLWVVLCLLLGSLVIGHLALVGYQMEIIQKRSRGRETEPVDFDPNRFVDYLVRGLIPAAVYLVISFGISALMSILMFGWMGLFAVLMGPHPRDAVALLMLVPLIGLVAIQVAAIVGVALPLTVRAGLSNDLAEGFKFKWAVDTAGLLWPTMLLCLFYVIACAFLSMFGLLFCLVGIFATSAWVQLVIADLGAQLVDIYHAKGGEALPMQGEPLQAEVI